MSTWPMDKVHQRIKCPTCNHPLDSATHAYGPDRMPRPGDLSCCIKCGEVMVFDPQLKPRLPTVDDALKWDSALFKQVSTLQKLIRKFHHD